MPLKVVNNSRRRGHRFQHQVLQMNNQYVEVQGVSLVRRCSLGNPHLTYVWLSRAKGMYKQKFRERFFEAAQLLMRLQIGLLQGRPQATIGFPRPTASDSTVILVESM